MTLTLDLTPELEQRLHELAEQRGQDASDCAMALLEDALAPEGFITMSDPPKTGAELVEYWKKAGVLGDWADRTDIGDSVEYARKLRERAQTREWD